MSGLDRMRCRNHPEREAVARCPSCERFFCRECVTEHQDRVICSRCLRAAAAETAHTGRGWERFWGALHGVCGFLVAWGVFYWVARVLIAIPAAMHEGTFWQQEWWGE